MIGEEQAVADGQVVVLAEEYIELEQGLKPMMGAIKRFAQLGSALELDAPARKKLEDRRQELATLLKGEPRRTTLPPRLVHASRVSIRLRHGDLVNLQAAEKKANIEANPDVAERIKTCELLGNKLGIQLDLVAHAPASEAGEAEPDPNQISLVE